MYKNLIIVLLANLLILIVYSQFQKSLLVNDGKGYDGKYYYELTEQLQNDEKLDTKEPFKKRIGTPLLVSLIFDDIIFGFKFINIFFSIALSLLIFLLANIFLNNYLAIAVSVIYQLHWVSGIRYILFDPIGTDYIPLFLIYLSFYIILKKPKHKYLLLILISSIGVIFREIAIIPLIALYIHDLYNKKFTITWKYVDFKLFSRVFYLMIPICVYVITLIIINGFEYDSKHNSIENAVKWFYIKGIGQYLLSIFNVVGLFLVIPIAFRNQLKSFDDKYTLLFISSILILLLSIIGGSDTERFIAWGLPLYSIIIVKIIVDNKIYESYVFYFIVLISILTFRLFWVTPYELYDGNNLIPVFTFISNNFNFTDLFAMHGVKKYTSVALIQYIILSVVMLFFIKIRKENEN